MALPNITVFELIVAVLVALVVWSFTKRRNSTSIMPPGTRVLPCMPTVPLLGSLPFMPTKFVDFPRFFMETSAKYGNVYALYMGTKYTVILNGIDTLSEALLKKSTHFADRGQVFLNSIANVDGKGIGLADYSEAFRRRRQMYLSILKQLGYGSREMEERNNVEVDELVKQARLIGGKSFDPTQMLHFCSLNSMFSVLFGHRCPYGHESLLELSQLMQDWFANVSQEIEIFPFLRFVPPFSGRVKRLTETCSKIMKYMEREVNKVLREVSIARDGDDKPDSFVRKVAEQTSTNLDKSPNLVDANFDRDELYQTLRDFCTAGDDTVSTMLRWFVLFLANYPEAQSRLQNEVDDVVGRDRMCSLDDEINMPYTQAFILEVLRMNPVAPLGLFHATACDTQLGDFFIPAKSTVIVNLYSASMESTKWNEPEIFKPERFLDENGRVTGKDRMVSFSLGKRACTGEFLARQQLFLFLAGIVQNFDVRPPEGQTKISYENMLSSIILQPSPFYVRMIARPELNPQED